MEPDYNTHGDAGSASDLLISNSHSRNYRPSRMKGRRMRPVDPRASETPAFYIRECSDAARPRTASGGAGVDRLLRSRCASATGRLRDPGPRHRRTKGRAPGRGDHRDACRERNRPRNDHGRGRHVPGAGPDPRAVHRHGGARRVQPAQAGRRRPAHRRDASARPDAQGRRSRREPDGHRRSSPGRPHVGPGRRQRHYGRAYQPALGLAQLHRPRGAPAGRRLQRGRRLLVRQRDDQRPERERRRVPDGRRAATTTTCEAARPARRRGRRSNRFRSSRSSPTSSTPNTARPPPASSTPSPSRAPTSTTGARSGTSPTPR